MTRTMLHCTLLVHTAILHCTPLVHTAILHCTPLVHTAMLHCTVHPAGTHSHATLHRAPRRYTQPCYTAPCTPPVHYTGQVQHQPCNVLPVICPRYVILYSHPFTLRYPSGLTTDTGFVVFRCFSLFFPRILVVFSLFFVVFRCFFLAFSCHRVWFITEECVSIVIRPVIHANNALCFAATQNTPIAL